ncbi:MAG: amidase [Acidobacteriaceae bacterium]|nr:amidase [Acidobacteriaceae bacterium]
MNVRAMGALLRSRQTSCLELVQQAIDRAKQQEELRAFIALTAAQAVAEAAERDRELQSGVDRGPFHGIPIAFKDLFYTRGVPTTAGSKVFENFVPDFDATVVERLRAAGAISLGKTNMHELAFGITSLNPHYGSVLNPIDKSRLAGGSSGGSAAAIAAGIVPMALGTDTGGSIRIPASYCGVVGLKPTYGVVSRHGVLPMAFSLDHVGPLGSCVEDCALTMNVIASTPTEFNLPPLENLKGLRVGVPRNFFFDRLDKGVITAVSRSLTAMERAGALVSDIRTPDFADLNVAAPFVQFAEFASLYVQQHDPSIIGADVWALLEQGRMVAGHEYVNAQRLRTVFRREMDALWQKVDLLVTPTTPIAAPSADQVDVTVAGVEETVRMASTRLVRGFNYLGEPALSMPCGKTANGMPVGLQLVGAPFTEARVLQVSKTLEGMLEWQP